MLTRATLLGTALVVGLLAASGAATAAAAEPVVRYTVRPVYVIPSDRDYDPRYADAIAESVRNIQGWFAGKLDGHTFTIGDPSPAICRGSNPAAFYERGESFLKAIDAAKSCGQRIAYPAHNHAWVVFFDAEHNCSKGPFKMRQGGYGVTVMDAGVIDGLLDPTGAPSCPDLAIRDGGWEGMLAHELGHALGLGHPRWCEPVESRGCPGQALMWRGWVDYPDSAHLTEDDVDRLLDSPFIRPPAPVEVGCSFPLDGMYGLYEADLAECW